MFQLSTTPQTLATLTPSLSTLDRDQLIQGKPMIVGHSGVYQAYLLVSGDRSTAWAVLHNYGAFAQFLPTVVSSRILKADGDRFWVEQVDRRRILLTTVESTIWTENIEREQTQIDFRLIKGDLKRLEGFWRIDAIAIDTIAGERHNCDRSMPGVLISHHVRVEAGVGPFDGIFFGIFEESLRQNLIAIGREVQRFCEFNVFVSSTSL